MDFYQLAKERFSVRKFDGKRVEKDKLDAILESGRIAPTTKNSQPQMIYVLESDEAIEKINKTSPCIYGAKTVLLICYDLNRVCKINGEPSISCATVDCSIVMTQMVLEAQNQGVNSCIVMYFDSEKVKEEFNLPKNIEPLILLPLGYGTKDAVPSPSHFSILDASETITYLK